MLKIRANLIFRHLRRQIKQNLCIHSTRLRYCFLILISLLVCIGIVTNQPQEPQALALSQLVQHKQAAQNETLQPIERVTKIANTWHNASFPVENFQSYSSGFGYRTDPVTGASQFHNGLDIAAPLGSYIRNWWTGQVVELSDNTACGTTIKIKSGQWQHTYCHLNGKVETNADGTYLLDADGGIQLWQGQNISAGARIGRIGMTGRTTGPHLHWVLTYDGEYIDPANVLRAMYAS
jgi:murein DD-endopeptidase MepM/ murein hydrolase activator NlpD